MKRICVVNTRAAHQQDALTKLCSYRGWDVLAYPCIGVKPINMDLLRVALVENCSSFRWLAVTSTNAVDVIATTFEGETIDLPPVACIGTATALYAQQKLGITCTFLPDEATAEAMALQLPVTAGDRVLLPQSMIAGTETAAILQARGVSVDLIHTYSVGIGSGGDSVAVAVIAGIVDAVMVTSPSTLHGFLSRMGADGVPRDILEKLMFAPIGPTTASSIAKNGLNSLPVPTEHSLEGLTEVLYSYFDRLDTPNETV